MLALCFIDVGLQTGIVKAKLHPRVCISKGCSVELDFSKMGTKYAPVNACFVLCPVRWGGAAVWDVTCKNQSCKPASQEPGLALSVVRHSVKLSPGYPCR